MRFRYTYTKWLRQNKMNDKAAGNDIFVLEF